MHCMQGSSRDSGLGTASGEEPQGVVYLSCGVVVCRSKFCVALQAVAPQIRHIRGAQWSATLRWNALHAAGTCLHVSHGATSPRLR